MPRDAPIPADLLGRLHMAGREVSSATIAFHSALAARRELSPSDVKAVDLLLRLGPLTHAELVRHTALAPASVTDLIDRLERKGLVARSRHPEDGRRVVVTANAEAIYADVAPLFADWVGALDEIYASYSDEQLEVICDCLARMGAAQQAAAERLAPGGAS